MLVNGEAALKGEATTKSPLVRFLVSIGLSILLNILLYTLLTTAVGGCDGKPSLRGEEVLVRQ